MIGKWLAQYEGKELELFRNYGNPYETISIRVQVADGMMYLGDEEVEHGPDGGSSIVICTFDQENTRKAFALLAVNYQDPILVLKNMLDETHRTRKFLDLCKENNITYDRNFYM